MKKEALRSIDEDFSNHAHPSDQAGHQARSRFWRDLRAQHQGIDIPDKNITSILRRKMPRIPQTGKKRQ